MNSRMRTTAISKSRNNTFGGRVKLKNNELVSFTAVWKYHNQIQCAQNNDKVPCSCLRRERYKTQVVCLAGVIVVGSSATLSDCLDDVTVLFLLKTPASSRFLTQFTLVRSHSACVTFHVNLDDTFTTFRTKFDPHASHGTAQLVHGVAQCHSMCTQWHRQAPQSRRMCTQWPSVCAGLAWNYCCPSNICGKRMCCIL